MAHAENGEAVSPSYSSLPSIVDLYILRRFISQFLLIMVVFLFLFEIFTFFELAEDIRRHNVPFMIVIRYFIFLLPYSVYQFTPRPRRVELGERDGAGQAAPVRAEDARLACQHGSLRGTWAGCSEPTSVRAKSPSRRAAPRGRRSGRRRRGR